MSLSRSPSPQEGGGWAAPGLEPTTEASATTKSYGDLNGAQRGVTWASAKAKSDRVNRYPSFSPINTSFSPLSPLRSFSWSLPVFNRPPGGKEFTAQSKQGTSRWKFLTTNATIRNLLSVLWRQIYILRLPLIILFVISMIITLFYTTSLHEKYKKNPRLGGGSKFVLVLGANVGGGVMEWKGPREWAIEKDSVKNKKKYAETWGYGLEIVDMATKKRYAHEWRESWEKVDTIRRCLHEYPDAEWFWWLDINTFIMEPSYSLQKHIFNNLGSNTYRDINLHNPLNITHPPNGTYLDPNTLSPVGDNDPGSINIIVPQDCSGFNLGSFFVRRSAWTDRLLDMWWDPVHYEQKHMQWEHKEQDAFEYLYASHPWIRPHVGFLPQRKANSFPPGACGENNATIHYDYHDRDFVVNMAGCEWGRDCWAEMYNYRELSNHLNRPRWQKFKDWVSGVFGHPKLVPGQDKPKTTTTNEGADNGKKES